MKNHTQQTLALAGIAQAASLVNQLARHGMVSQEKFSTCLDSIFVTRPKKTEDVYGRVSQLNLGLQVLQEIFQGSSGSLKNPDIIRYILALLYLERKLHKRPELLNTISQGLEVIRTEYPEADRVNSREVVSRLGALYQETVSTLNSRIQVKGDMQFLRNEDNAAKIRAILLAGIRSAVLWRQLGGKRWFLLFYRKRISRDILLLLSNTQDYVS